MTDEEKAAELKKLHYIDGKTILAPRGHHQAKLMLVVSHLSFDDLESKRIMGKDSGMELSNALSIANIPEEMCWITSILKTGIGSKSKPSAAQLEEAWPKFQEELDLVKPELIITLGAEAFKAMMHSNVKQDDYIGEIIDSPHGKIMPAYSPRMVTALDPTLRVRFRDQFKYAAKYLMGNLNFTPFEYRIVTSPEENKSILEGYINKKQLSIGYDAEWCGKKYTHDEVMYTFQYSCESHKAIILPIAPDGLHENMELLNSMKVMLERPDVDRLGWNIRSDDKRLVFRGIVPREETLGFDGMKAVALFDSRVSKGLETGIQQFTNYEHYYVDLVHACRRHKLVRAELAKVLLFEPDVFYKYCAGDAVSHYTACINMRERMKKELNPRVVEYYFNVYLPLSNYLLDLETTGLPIDQELMEEMTQNYVGRYGELKEELLKSLKDDFDVSEFNPNSSQDKLKLLYKDFKLNPPFYTKSGKSPKPRAWYDKQKATTKRFYSPSANSKSLSTLRFEMEQVLNSPNADKNSVFAKQYNIVKKMLMLGRVGVFANKFLSKVGTDFIDDVSLDDREDDDPLKASYWNALHPDGRIHADFFECLDPFRASSRVNVQNPAAKVLSHIPECFEGSNFKVPNHLRQIFYTGDKNWYYGEVDCAGADLAIMAFLSGDSKFIRDMREGNFHVKKMREYFKNDALTKKDASHYVTAKSITFRVSYTAELKFAAIPIQAEIFAESGNFIPLDQIEYALETWNRYAEYIQYREICKNMVQDKGYIENARGMRLMFDHCTNFNVVAGWLNESLAFPIASELALFMWDVAVSMKNRMLRDKVWKRYIHPCNTIHDAHHWLIHKDLMKDNYFPEVARAYFTKEVKLASGDCMGAELVIADRWKGSNKIFSNETVWDFKESCWKWK